MISESPCCSCDSHVARPGCASLCARGLPGRFSLVLPPPARPPVMVVPATAAAPYLFPSPSSSFLFSPSLLFSRSRVSGGLPPPPSASGLRPRASGVSSSWFDDEGCAGTVGSGRVGPDPAPLLQLRRSWREASANRRWWSSGGAGKLRRSGVVAEQVVNNVQVGVCIGEAPPVWWGYLVASVGDAMFGWDFEVKALLRFADASNGDALGRCSLS